MKDFMKNIRTDTKKLSANSGEQRKEGGKGKEQSGSHSVFWKNCRRSKKIRNKKIRGRVSRLVVCGLV